MFKKILVALSLVASVSAQAYTMQNLAQEVGSSVAQQAASSRGMFNFKVGDTASYKLQMGFLPGTMVMTVTNVVPDEVTISQVMTMLGQKQDCVEILNPNTGEMKSMTCNGQAQDSGDASDIEVIDQKEDTVTVPAGTFTCLYIKAKQKSNGNEIEQWINPSEIPVFGMAKSTMPSQMGKVVIELTSFKKAQ
jgi:hypothetical protein